MSLFIHLVHNGDVKVDGNGAMLPTNRPPFSWSAWWQTELDSESEVYMGPL